MERELTSTIYDQCEIQRHAGDNSQKLKFMTTNFTDLENANKYSTFFGLYRQDGLYTPNSSNINAIANSELTNQRVKTQLGQLPLPTMPGKYFQNAYGDPEIESTIRTGISTYDGKPCIPSFYNRHFQIFPDSATSHLPINSVENYDRGGKSSRVSFRKGDVRK